MLRLTYLCYDWREQATTDRHFDLCQSAFGKTSASSAWLSRAIYGVSLQLRQAPFFCLVFPKSQAQWPTHRAGCNSRFKCSRQQYCKKFYSKYSSSRIQQSSAWISNSVIIYLPVNVDPSMHSSRYCLNYSSSQIRNLKWDWVLKRTLASSWISEYTEGFPVYTREFPDQRVHEGLHQTSTREFAQTLRCLWLIQHWVTQ